uniref:Nuclear factor related to kappa-B-binding protein winged helix-like domain-containing protein n=1 Tax=Ciona savignyi TaxID=51511 RepID=H2Y5W8_CIOSA
MMSDIVVDGEVITLPMELVQNPNLIKEVLTMEVWGNLSDEKKKSLLETLPEFLSEDDRTETVRLLLSGGNLSSFSELSSSHPNPVAEFARKVSTGYFTPEVYRLRERYNRCRRSKMIFLKHRYFHQILREVVVSRQCHLAAHSHPHELKLSRPKKESCAEGKSLELGESSRQLYHKILSDTKRQIVTETNFTEEDVMSSDDEVTMDPSSPNPYLEMLIRHKIRRDADVDTPDMDTTGIKLSDVVSRTFSTTKKLHGIGLLARRRKWEGKILKQKRIKKSIQTVSAKRKKTCELSEFPPKQESNKSKVRTMPSCFFELIRDVIKLSTEKTINSVKQLVSDWLGSSESSRYHWTTMRSDWSIHLDSALQ